MIKRHAFRLLLPAALLAAAACSDSSVTAPVPAEDLGEPLTRTATIDQIADRAATGALRLEIDVRAGGPPWIAREVEVENDDDDEEKIESRITAADASGRIEILFGGLAIDVSTASRFRIEGVGDVTRERFMERIAAHLAAGRTPGVELRRRLPSTPQDPNDPTFSPRDVRLDDDADVGDLEVLVDDRHLATAGDGTGRVTVFGVEIVVDPSLGSEVGERDDDADGAVELEGLVEAVDPASGLVRLVGGTEVWIGQGTRFDDDDDDDHLGSLAEVAAALAAGHWVEMEAEVVRRSDGSWLAVKVEFEIEDDVDDDLPGAMEFEDEVVTADPGAGTFTLEDGRIFTLGDQTRVDGDGDVVTLEAVAGALAAGLEVEAEGTILADAAAPGGWRLLEVKFETDDDDDDDDDD